LVPKWCTVQVTVLKWYWQGTKMDIVNRGLPNWSGTEMDHPGVPNWFGNW